MHTLVHVSPYCYIRFRVPEKGSLSKEHKFSSLDHVINTRMRRKLMKMKEIYFRSWISYRICCRGISS
jgi:S-ribosylhomocysteine lyase LuxS involved in autoinducer biosynthesis